MKRPGYLLLAIVLLAGILLMACSSPATTPATTTGPAQTTTTTTAPTQTTTSPKPTQTTTSPPAGGPKYGGVLKQIHFIAVTNVGYIPQYSDPYDWWIAESAMESLLRVDENGALQPLLATDWVVGSDLKSVTFTLRKGVKFHDGTDFNAQAVKYNLDLFKTGGQNTLDYVSTVDVIDDYTVKVNFATVQAGYLIPFATRPGQMQSPTALQAHPKEYFLTNMVGTGPFIFDSYVRDIKMTFKKNPNYWQPGKPYLDGIEWLWIADRTTGLMSFQAGEAHSMMYPQEKDRKGLVDAGFKMVPSGGPIFTMLVDSGNPDSPFGDLKVRQAVYHAIDVSAMAKLGFGYWEAVNQWSYPSHWSYNPDVVGYPYDPVKAKLMLGQAGYPNGFKTQILATGTNDYVDLLQRYLKAIEIDAEIVTGTMATAAEWRQNGWTNAVRITPIGGPSPYKDDRMSLRVFGSTSGQYPTALRSSDIDEFIAQGDVELNPEKMKSIYQDLNKLLVDTYAIHLPLWFNPGYRAESPDVHDFNFQVLNGGRWRPEDAWLGK